MAGGNATVDSATTGAGGRAGGDGAGAGARAGSGSGGGGGGLDPVLIGAIVGGAAAWLLCGCVVWVVVAAHNEDDPACPLGWIVVLGGVFSLFGVVCHKMCCSGKGPRGGNKEERSVEPNARVAADWISMRSGERRFSGFPQQYKSAHIVPRSDDEEEGGSPSGQSRLDSFYSDGGTRCASIAEDTLCEVGGGGGMYGGGAGDGAGDEVVATQTNPMMTEGGQGRLQRLNKHLSVLL